jgi:hypothetical protein
MSVSSISGATLIFEHLPSVRANIRRLSTKVNPKSMLHRSKNYRFISIRGEPRQILPPQQMFGGAFVRDQP